MSEGLSEESGGHRPGSLGGMERDEWCQQTEPGFKGNGKKEESSLPPGYSCGGGVGGGACHGTEVSEGTGKALE